MPLARLIHVEAACWAAAGATLVCAWNHAWCGTGTVAAAKRADGACANARRTPAAHTRFIPIILSSGRGWGGRATEAEQESRVVATTCAQAKLRLANGATCAEQPTGDIYNFLSVNDLIITLAAQGLFPQMMMRPLDGVTPLTRSVLPRTTKPVTDGCRGAPVYSPLSQASPAFLHPVRSILRFCAEIRTEPSADGGKQLLATSSTPPLPFEAQTMNQRQRPPF